MPHAIFETVEKQDRDRFLCVAIQPAEGIQYLAVLRINSVHQFRPHSFINNYVLKYSTSSSIPLQLPR